MTKEAKPKRSELGRNNLSLLRLGLTIGDPAGIGPEILLKCLAQKRWLPAAQYFIFGPPSIIETEAKALEINIDLLPFLGWENSSGPGIFLFPVEEEIKSVKKGMASAEGGQASFTAFVKAVQMAEEGYLQAVITAPISKLSWSLAGLPWRGHTEYLEQLYPQAIMAFWSRKLKLALFSHHLPLIEAVKRINCEDLVDFFLRLNACFQAILGSQLEYLVAGLNPHAGEDGLLGEEEKKEIIPAIAEVRCQGLNFSGPYPPDVVYRQAIGKPRCLVVALYHDQGLIAFKLLSFVDGVNVTLGLPFVRTSPDHGTAFNIASQRIASEKSMMAAISLAYKMAKRLVPKPLHLSP